MKHPKKVELLKDAIDVSGKALVKKGTDLNVIDEQIDILLNMTFRTTDQINSNCDKILREIDQPDDKVKNYIKTEVYNFVTMGEYDPSFWEGFGSAPYYQKHEDEKGNGGVGMDTIFGDKFEKCYDLLGKSNNSVESLFKDYISLKEKKIILPSSPFKDLNDIENNVVMRKIEEVSKIFWNDNTKDLEERIKVFNRYGREESYIYHPVDKKLNKIFNFLLDGDMIQRHEKVYCLDLIDHWVDKLSENRCKISYNRNEFHPDLLEKRRNYTPSDESIERLSNYYKLLTTKEGVSSFTLDW